jgi:hypothetical protein
MGRLVQLLVLALDAALYATLLAAVVIVLSQPRRLTFWRRISPAA